MKKMGDEMVDPKIELSTSLVNPLKPLMHSALMSAMISLMVKDMVVRVELSFAEEFSTNERDISCYEFDLFPLVPAWLRHPYSEWGDEIIVDLAQDPGNARVILEMVEEWALELRGRIEEWER